MLLLVLESDFFECDYEHHFIEHEQDFLILAPRFTVTAASDCGSYKREPSCINGLNGSVQHLFGEL